MDRLQDAVLVRSELLEFGLEKLIFLTGRSFLVQDENVANIVGMNLLFQILEHLLPLPLHKLQFLQKFFDSLDLTRHSLSRIVLKIIIQ